jgi:hypothetical protein
MGLWQRAALRDFGPVDDRYGSLASDAVDWDRGGACGGPSLRFSPFVLPHPIYGPKARNENSEGQYDVGEIRARQIEESENNE